MPALANGPVTDSDADDASRGGCRPANEGRKTAASNREMPANQQTSTGQQTNLPPVPEIRNHPTASLLGKRFAGPGRNLALVLGHPSESTTYSVLVWSRRREADRARSWHGTFRPFGLLRPSASTISRSRRQGCLSEWLAEPTKLYYSV